MFRVVLQSGVAGTPDFIADINVRLDFVIVMIRMIKKGDENSIGQGIAGLVPINKTLDSSYIPSKYSKAYNLYSRNQINTVLPFVLSISKTCPFSSLYPIFKLLKATCKIFMLNEIEVVLLAFLIKQTKWDINEKTIFHNAENVQDIIYCSIDHLDYKRIILYLMLTSFTVKFYLNENSL